MDNFIESVQYGNISLNTSPHSEQKMLNGVLTLLGCDSSNQTFDKTFEII